MKHRGPTRRIALLSSEAIRPRMGGIGIRYLELARRLPRPGLEVVLLTPGDPADVPAELPLHDVRRFARGRVAELTADCDGAVAQGQLANDLVLEAPHLPAALDFYDPFLIENLHYAATFGLDSYRNDHATWVLQLARGDFFLCSCEEQRLFYLGLLTALGRLNPARLLRDPDLLGLIDVVPFGVPETLPPLRPLLPERRPGECRLLFGGLYDWYDPWPVLEALAQVDDPAWTLLFIRNPNLGVTPQTLWHEVETWCRRRDLWESRVLPLDWIPAERRFDLLREVDLMVATHRLNVETRLSLRTRFLDALAAGCPVVASDGGAMSRLLRRHDAGWIVPPGDAAALVAAFREVLGGGPPVARRLAAAAELSRDFSWEKVLAPLVRFCLAPRTDPTKEEFAFKPATVAPKDSLPFRARRWLRRHLRWPVPV